MDNLKNVFSLIQKDTNFFSVSGDFIPAPKDSDNAGSNYFYVNCHSKSVKDFSKSDYREAFLSAVSRIKGMGFEQDFVSVVFSIYRVTQDKNQRLYRAVIWASDLSQASSADDLDSLLAREEVYS